MSPCFKPHGLTALSNRLHLSHTWIPSMQPGDNATSSTPTIFTCKFFHYYLDLSQIDWHRRTDMIAFKQNYIKVELTQFHNKHTTINS
jgi:hypothetical protein